MATCVSTAWFADPSGASLERSASPTAAPAARSCPQRLVGLERSSRGGFDDRPRKQRARHLDGRFLLPPSRSRIWRPGGSAPTAASRADTVYLVEFVFRHKHHTPMATFRTLLGFCALASSYEAILRRREAAKTEQTR
jgi:hypothetical protein